MNSFFVLFIIIYSVYADQCSNALIYNLNPKSETYIVTSSCSSMNSKTFVRPYYIYNDINYLMQIFPHVALEVQTCHNGDCIETTYGKAQNSKIYSPDILTEGRDCKGQFFSKCKRINPGYNKKNITDWIPIENQQNTDLHRFIQEETLMPSSYSLLFNNCATFVRNILNKIGVSFSCKMGYFDLPYCCA